MASSNGLRMPFAEWLWRMSMAKLSPSKRMVATYAAAFNITSNSDLEKLTGLSEETLRGIKQQLPKDGFVIIEAGIGGRGHGARVFPAFNQTPLTFTDLSPRNPHKYYGPKVPGTPQEITPLIEKTPGVFQGVPKKVSPTPPSKNLLLTEVEQEDRFNSLTPTVELDAAREGETGIGNGVFVNCETVRHANFEISLKAIQLQLCGTVDMDTIKSVAAGHALQWATDIASGKSPSKIVPSNTASFIRASIQNQANNAAVTEVRKTRVAGNSGSKRMSLKELNDGVDAAYDRNFFGQTKGITHER
jgi:hypothetical protein